MASDAGLNVSFREPPDPATELLTIAYSIDAILTQNRILSAPNRTEISGFLSGIRRIATVIKARDTPANLNPISEIYTTLAEVRDEVRQLRDQRASACHSYADVTRPGAEVQTTLRSLNRENKTEKIKHTKHAIIITHPSASASETMNEIKAKVTFRDLKFAPTKLTTLAKGKIKMEFADVTQRDAVLNRCKNIESFTASAAALQKPMLIVKGVPTSTGREELTKIIHEQNDIPMDQPIRLCFLKKNRRNDNLYNAIIEVSPNVRLELLEKQRINIDHLKVHVEDFVPLLQCYHCLRFGHTANKCNEKSPTCSHCSLKDHKADDCPEKNRGNPPKCANCLKHNEDTKGAKWSTNHTARDHNYCNQIKSALLRIQDKTDYGC